MFTLTKSLAKQTPTIYCTFYYSLHYDSAKDARTIIYLKVSNFIDAVITKIIMEDYVHIYKIPRSQVQQAEASRDSRTESFLDNRKSRHDYEPVTFNQGETDIHQQPHIQETTNTEKKDIKQQMRRFFCIHSIIWAVALVAIVVTVAVSLTIITIRSNALSDQVADLQQQLDELKLVQVKEKLISSHAIIKYVSTLQHWTQKWTSCNISFMDETCSAVTSNETVSAFHDKYQSIFLNLY